MKTALKTLFVLFFVSTSFTFAADEKDLVGKWKWSSPAGGGGKQPRDTTATIKLENGKLSLTMPGRNNQDTVAEDVKFKDGELTFSITRERNGQKSVTKFKGKLEGDTIKGKIESERDGKAGEPRDWEAKRVKE